MLVLLGKHDGDLKDPQSHDSDQPTYADNPWWAPSAALFVTIGIWTYLGCLPKAHFQPSNPTLGARCLGGFLCPCHGSRSDLAARVLKSSPASVNLVIPPYAFASERKFVIGTDTASSSAT
jgi:ubiquinol-cytochrome c reductase iron-sulfur subunit